MASITVRTTKSGDKRYRVRVRTGGENVVKSFGSLRAAKSFIRETEGAIETGEFVRPTDKTLADAITRYRRDVLPEKAEKTRIHQDRQLTWWESELGDSRLHAITSARVIEARDDLIADRGVSGPTANRYTAILSHVFSMAVQWGWVRDNPVRSIAKRRENPGRARFLSRDELTRLLDECRKSRQPELELLVMMALSTGMRRGELLGLRWSEVDLDRGLARLIDTKNGEARAVTLTPTVRAHLKERALKTGLVFHAPGEPDRPLDPRGAFEAACERAGIADFVWHDLRHTTASYLAMSGATLAEIAAVLGHKTLQMVKRYSHLSDDHVSGVIERMDQRWLS